MHDMLEMERVTAGYGDAIVLDRCTLSMAEGESLAILGRNVRPSLCVVRIVVIRRHRFLSCHTMRRRYGDEKSQAQQNPTMNEATCFHVLTVS